MRFNEKGATYHHYNNIFYSGIGIGNHLRKYGVDWDYLVKNKK